MKRCLDCQALTNRTRCRTCESTRQQKRNAKRTHYRGDYARRAAQVRANAERCWICGEGERAGDPWQADHLVPGDPHSELLPAHRSCNARRGNARAAFDL